MPARSSRDALRQHADITRRALSCVTREVAREGQRSQDGLHFLALGQGSPVRLRGRRDLFVRVSTHYDAVTSETTLRGWSIQARAYWYYIFEDTDASREILAYHWHPDAVIKHTHLHPGAAMMRGLDWLRTLHLPTGEVSIGDFIVMLITDFGVRPLRSDWERILESVRAGN